MNPETLPQLDASSLVDGERLAAAVKDMYRDVARGGAELHFEVGRRLAEHLGYDPALLDAIPAEAVASFAGVGHHLDLAALQPGETVLDLGSGSGTDIFCAAAQVGETGARASRRSSSSSRGSRRCPSPTRASTPSSPTASSTSRCSRARSSPRPPASCGPGGGSRSPTSSPAER